MKEVNWNSVYVIEELNDWAPKVLSVCHKYWFFFLSLSKMYSLYFAFPSGEIQPLALASFTFFSCFKCILFIHTYLSNLIKRPTLTYFFPLQRNVFKRKCTLCTLCFEQSLCFEITFHHTIHYLCFDWSSGRYKLCT